MNEPMIWAIVSTVVVLGLTTLVYLLREKLPNLGNTILTLFGLAIAFGSLYVSIVTLQETIKDSEEQQKSLDTSRAQLQAVVDAANKQQDILSKNLETSKSQQEILTKNLETSKSQLNLLEEQWKREPERQARKPTAEITLQTTTGPKPLDDLEKLPEIDFPLEHGKRWKEVVFHVLNNGKVEIITPTVRIVSSQDTVAVEREGTGRHREGGILRDPTIHNAIQFSSPEVNDIEPAEVAGGGYKFTVDITVPDSINAFDLTFLIHGKNLSRKAHTLHFKGYKAIFLSVNSPR